MTSNTIQRIVRGIPVSDGAGVRLNRILGQPALPALDPFLMLDEFRSSDRDDYMAGFPPHPHRGFETVTYMKMGRFRHEDSVGNSGLLEDGGLQWMTAGRGIIHSEMPEMHEGQLWGYQLWINLPASLKMSPPAYQDMPADKLPIYESDSMRVKILAGSYQDYTSPVQVLHPVSYFDITLQPESSFSYIFPEGWQPFAYVHSGSLSIEGECVSAGQAVVFTMGKGLRMQADADGAGLLLLASPPIQEPVARHGPFVMNTPAELEQAFRDYQQGTLAS